MKIKKLIPIIYVNAFQDSINFYVETLGFTIITSNPEWEWARIQRDEGELMISKPNEHIPFEKPEFTGSFYFHSDKVSEFWNDIKDKVKVCYPLEDFEYGMREFAIYDNNGYLLQFGQEINE